ncbi:MAG: winged helix-turn-helix domain-containing protein [Halodesulfurarchaeum sp.]
MTDPDQAVRVERLSAEDVFAILGDSNRIAILEALVEFDDTPVSFSVLRERVGMRDSGQFNYHLKKLSDHFIRHTEEGYELTLAGEQVVGALLAGTYTATAELSDIPVPDSECLECGGTLSISYEDEVVEIQCAECGKTHGVMTFPPGALDQYSPAELPDAFARWLRAQFAQAVAGFCPNCSGRVDGHLDRDDDGHFIALMPCERCGSSISSSVAALLLFDPSTISYCHEHGVDITSRRFWDLEWLSEDNATEVGTDPLEVRVRISMDGEILDAVVGEDLSVQSVERR